MPVKMRSYPIAFGLRILRFLPKICAGATGLPPLATSTEQVAVDMFKALPTEDNWSGANLEDVIRYLRGSIHLRLPEYWKQVFPTEI